MRLLLTRHGQTDWNVAGKFQGVTDIELNQKGMKQAEETREKLRNEQLDVVISSPLKRAKKTAEIIIKGRDIPLIIDQQVKERCFGKFEGKTREEINFEELWNYKLNKQYEDAESTGAVFERIGNFLERIKEEYQDKTVLLVTHGGIIVPIRAILEGIPEEMEVLEGFGIDNCEIKEYDL